MKKLISLLSFVMCCMHCVAQTYVEPVFDMTDTPDLHINKIEVTKDTTFVYCTLSLSPGNSPNISKNTYLFEKENKQKYTIIKSPDLPYGPERKTFMFGGNIPILFCFPSIGKATQIDFIENSDERAFNIYGIKLNEYYKKIYTETDIEDFHNMASVSISDNDTIKSIEYKEQEKSAAAFIYGTKSEQLLMVAYDLYNLYEKFGFYQRANEQKKKITSYIDALNDSFEKWQLISSLSNVFSHKNDFVRALEYSTKAVELGKKVFGINHSKFASSLTNLASCYSNQGNYVEAVRVETEAVEIIKKFFGINHPQYVVSLSQLAVYNSYQGNYEEATRLGTEAVEISKRIFGLEHPNYAIALGNLANFYSGLGNKEKAIQLGMEASEIQRKVLGTEHLDYAALLNNLASYYSSIGNYSEAIRLGTEALEISKRLLGIEHPICARVSSDLATFYAKLGNNEEAIRLVREALEIWKETLGIDNPYYAASANALAGFYYALGNYEKAIQLGIHTLEIEKQVLGIEHPYYATSLNNIAACYSALGNYEEAIRLGTEALDIRKRILGIEHPDYAASLSSLTTYYAHLGNNSKAIRLEKEALEIRKRVLGTEHPDYATSLSNLAACYSNLGNYGEAIRLCMEALEIRKRVLGTGHPDYATSLNNIASYYTYLGNYDEAIRLGTEALEIRKRVLGTGHPDYAASLNNLASFFSTKGNFGEAIRLGMEALEIMERTLGTEHPNYATTLNNLASSYADLGNYSEAIRLGTEALEIRKRVLGTEHPDYVTSLNNIALDYYCLGNYYEAIRLDSEALEIMERALGTEHPNYATTLNNLASSYADLGNYNEAIRLCMEALEIRKRVLGTENPDYATVLNNIASYYTYLGNYDKAIRLGTEALEFMKRSLGTEHPDYATSLNNLARIYSNQRNHAEAYFSFQKSIELSQANVLRHFVKLSSHQRESFWGKNEYIYNKALPSYVYRYKNAESIAELYNITCLFAKGLLLNSDIELRKLILESDDSILIDKYNTLSTNISIYNKLIEKPIDERFMNSDSLNNVIQQQEMELARESKVYGDYTRNLTSTWKDVRNNLGADDIAVEFIDFPIGGTDSIMYAALTLKKDYDSPHMVTLFEKTQLMTISDSSHYMQTSTYDLIWKPLESELEDVKNIYFAPSGELHRIGIEYVPASLTENISDRYSLHRLSSTRQLTLIQDGTKGEQSILYGGINYDENTNATEDISTSSLGGVRGIDITYRSNVDSLLLRSSYEYLEGTKKEVDEIADQMKQRQIRYLYYSGSDGSEESFKQLDGTRPKVMHIATHGFYLTEEEAKQSQLVRPYMELMMGGNQRIGRPIEDKPMTRSGLLFSGCNHAIHHEQIPDEVEDGILTAQEISTLDLRGLDLVVLSACQTALGDIASGEGVFGLQRGFKKAGAKTIIMSLWKVDDEATRILMVELYKNLLSGKSKQQSLKDAQKYLREFDNGKYDKPEYWASFIMLDGLK